MTYKDGLPVQTNQCVLIRRHIVPPYNEVPPGQHISHGRRTGTHTAQHSMVLQHDTNAPSPRGKGRETRAHTQLTTCPHNCDRFALCCANTPVDVRPWARTGPAPLSQAAHTRRSVPAGRVRLLHRQAMCATPKTTRARGTLSTSATRLAATCPQVQLQATVVHKHVHIHTRARAAWRTAPGGLVTPRRGAVPHSPSLFRRHRTAQLPMLTRPRPRPPPQPAARRAGPSTLPSPPPAARATNCTSAAAQAGWHRLRTASGPFWSWPCPRPHTHWVCTEHAVLWCKPLRPSPPHPPQQQLLLRRSPGSLCPLPRLSRPTAC